MKSLLELAVEDESWRSIEILEAYAKHYGKNKGWLSSPQAGKTIQELIDDSCDNLEGQGLDLSVTGVESVIENMLETLEVHFEVPEGYNDLQNALQSVENIYENYKNLKINNPEQEKVMTDVISQIKNNIEEMITNG